MGKESTGKIASLAIAVTVITLQLIGIVDKNTAGLSVNSDLYNRMTYMFVHANVLHATLNAWCMLSVIFIYGISAYGIATAMVIATTIPTFCLLDTPTVGLSGMVYALFGMIAFMVKRKMYYQTWMIAYIALGFVMPMCNGWVHLYCYAIGIVVALLNKPIRRNVNGHRKRNR